METPQVIKDLADLLDRVAVKRGWLWKPFPCECGQLMRSWGDYLRHLGTCPARRKH